MPCACVEQAHSRSRGQRFDMLLDEGSLVHAQLAQASQRSCPQLLLCGLLLQGQEYCIVSFYPEFELKLEFNGCIQACTEFQDTAQSGAVGAH